MKGVLSADVLAGLMVASMAGWKAGWMAVQMGNVKVVCLGEIQAVELAHSKADGWVRQMAGQLAARMDGIWVAKKGRR